jgi:hypothetical protein
MSSPPMADAILSPARGRAVERSAGYGPAGALMAANESDSGQPITDLPPLIEPTFEPVGQRPPRRSFLSPATAAPATAPASPVVSFDIPEVVEPVPAPADAVAPLPGEKTSVWPRWIRLPAAARAISLTRKNWRPIAGVGLGVALVLVAAVAVVRHTGRVSQVRHYSTAAAPANLPDRVAYYQQGAQEGDANAQLHLAILYAKGEGLTQDYAAAANWFRAAANQGVARAQYDLGVLYERGRGMPVDLTEAANWYLKAAQGNYPLAQYNIAVCYTKGQGIRQDLAEAAVWYRRAALQGVVQAMTNLGQMYEKGEGVPVSPVDAYAWYSAAGRRNNEAAAHRASELFATLPHLDQIRSEALASDVAGSIHDPEAERGEPTAGNP